MPLDFSTSGVILLSMEIICDIERVHIHPDNLEIRGSNPSLTGLRDSIQQDGQAYALAAVLGDDGDYYVYDGGRRLASLAASGATQVRLSVETLTRPQILYRIAVSNMKEPFPHVVVEGGRVVGGKAWLVKELLAEGARKDQVATALNERIDVISAYISLLDEPENILNIVASGKLEITSYARIKYKSPEFKERLVAGAKGKKVPVRAVLKAIQEDNAEAVSEMVQRPRPQVEMVDNDVVAAMLRVRAGLVTIKNADVDLSEYEAWYDICELVDEMG